MAMTTLRMKCLWCPYICIMASVMICDQDLWKLISNKLTNSLPKGTIKRTKWVVLQLIFKLPHVLVDFMNFQQNFNCSLCLCHKTWKLLLGVSGPLTLPVLNSTSKHVLCILFVGQNQPFYAFTHLF